jgi:ATP-dependent Clp protease protease subunit
MGSIADSVDNLNTLLYIYCMSKKTTESDLVLFHDTNCCVQTRTILLAGVVDDDMLNEFYRNMHILEQTPGDINITLNSNGGDVEAALAIYDTIRLANNFVRITVLGQASSSASFILQAGDERCITENSFIMIHQGYQETAGHPAINKNWIKKYKEDDELVEDIYYAEMLEKDSNFQKRKLKDMLMFDTIFRAREALDHGLVDKIITKKD